jgi:MFS family permease
VRLSYQARAHSRRVVPCAARRQLYQGGDATDEIGNAIVLGIPMVNTITQPTAPESHPAPAEKSYPSLGYAWYVVAVLTLAYVFSFIDRQILNLLVGPIQRDLGISEKKMSLLMGASFAVFYTFFGIPLARLADTRSRRMLITVGIVCWSLMTAGCGLTRKFWQLAVMRMGVGIGEASLSPSAYSLIADYFRPEHRSTAIGVYSIGIYIGTGLAFILGGMVIGYTSTQESFDLILIGPIRSWQLVFFIVGLPGLLVGLLLLSVREPTRQGVARSEDGRPGAAEVPIRQVWGYISDNWATFLCLNLGLALVSLFGYGATSWIPTFFIRRHGWTPANTGMVFGWIVAVSGTLGIVTGGRLADWMRRKGRVDANFRVAWLSVIAALPFLALFPIASAGFWAAVFLTPAIFFCSMPFGLAPAAIQQMMPNSMRAQATACYLFVINLIGLGLGPTVVAVLTEDVFQDKNAVHYSLLIVAIAAHSGAAVLLGLGLKPYRQSLAYLERWHEAEVRSRPS